MREALVKVKPWATDVDEKVCCQGWAGLANRPQAYQPRLTFYQCARTSEIPDICVSLVTFSKCFSSPHPCEVYKRKCPVIFLILQMRKLRFQKLRCTEVTR